MGIRNKKKVFFLIVIILFTPLFQSVRGSTPRYNIILFMDDRYSGTWLGNDYILDVGTRVASNLKSANVDYHIVNAEGLEQIMGDGDTASGTIIVMLQGIFPNLVWTGKPDSLAIQWINAGGTLVWTGDIEFAYIGYANGTRTDTGGMSLKVLYGRDIIGQENLTVVPTKIGSKFMPSFSNFTSDRAAEKNRLIGFNYTAFGVSSNDGTEYYDPVEIHYGKGSIVRIGMTPQPLMTAQLRASLISELILNYYIETIVVSQGQGSTVVSNPGIFAVVSNWLSTLSLQTFVYLVAICGGVISIYSFFVNSKSEKNRQKVLFKNFNEKIDEVYKKFKMNSRECETELYKLKGEIVDEFKNKKIEPNYYNFLEKRIQEYMNEIKEQINKER